MQLGYSLAMRVVLVTPYLPAARNGNAHTALRWRRFLRAAGHRVDMVRNWAATDGEMECDAMVALHARRSHTAIADFAGRFPSRPLIVVLTGTDLYRDIHIDADAQRSLELASALVVLQDEGVQSLPAIHRHKARVIYQSCASRVASSKPKRMFSVGCVAHLRDEKAPFLLAQALAYLPDQTRVHAWHVGDELQAGMRAIAMQLNDQLPRWRWLGALPHGETRRRIARSHLLVVSSHMEGGANVICEAITSGTPVLASRIAGNIGMLGADYAGYFEIDDSMGLATLISRAETDVSFYQWLAEQCQRRAPLFMPEREAMGVQALLPEARS